MMYILRKSITAFLLPPGIFALLLAAAAVYALWCRQYPAALVSAISGTLIWLLSAGITADILMGRLEAGIPIPSHPRADVIVLLGSGIHAQAPDFSGIGAPTAAGVERLTAAARLYRRHGWPILVTGGRIASESVSSAVLCKRFLVDLGVPPEAVLMEEKSLNTYQNAIYSKQVCDREGLRRALLVTSGYHLPRAVYCFEKAGLPVIPFPCGLRTWPAMRHAAAAWLPDATSLAATSAALHEWIGLLYYRLLYR